MTEKDVIDEFSACWVNFRMQGDMLKTYAVYQADLSMYAFADLVWVYREARGRYINPNVPDYGKNNKWEFFPKIAEVTRLVCSKMLINKAYEKVKYLVKQFGIDCSIGIDDPILAESINSMGGLHRLVTEKMQARNYNLFAVAYGTSLLNYELSKVMPISQRIKGRHELNGKAWTSILVEKFVINRNDKCVKVDITYKKLKVKGTQAIEIKTAELLGEPLDVSKIKPFRNGRDM